MSSTIFAQMAHCLCHMAIWSSQLQTDLLSNLEMLFLPKIGTRLDTFHLRPRIRERGPLRVLVCPMGNKCYGPITVCKARKAPSFTGIWTFPMLA